jgi:hypothetical protein
LFYGTKATRARDRKDKAIKIGSVDDEVMDRVLSKCGKVAEGEYTYQRSPSLRAFLQRAEKDDSRVA